MDSPEPARWRISHGACIPNTPNEYGLELPRTYKELVKHTAHVLGKTWIHDTDLDEFLYEAVDQRDRWAPA